MTSPDTPSPPVTPSAAGKRVLPWLVAVAFFMESLDTTILNTAVPAISAALNVAPLSMKAVLASYTLSLAVFIPLSGWTADRYGTRRVFAAAIGLFTLSSALCGMVSDIRLLVLCRMLQGCGGALMVPVGRLTLVRTFAKSELIRTMSFVAIPALVGPMLGPTAGGLVVHYFHWRVIFFINVPVGIAGLVLVYLLLPDFREKARRRLDVVGLILFGAGIGLLSYVLEVFGEHTLSTLEMVGLLTAAFALIGGYVLHARRKKFPLLQLKLFGIRTFGVAASGSFITRLGLGGVPFLLPLLYQIGLGYSAVQSGLLIMPQALAAMSTKTYIRRLLARIGYRRLLVTNTIALGAALALFGTIGPDTPVWLIVVQAFTYGMLTSMQYSSMNTLIYADIAERDTSAASSIASTVQQMSLSFGVAAAGLATAFFVPESLRAAPAELVAGIHQAFWVLGAFTILSTLVFRRLLPGDGGAVSQQKQLHVG